MENNKYLRDGKNVYLTYQTKILKKHTQQWIVYTN